MTEVWVMKIIAARADLDALKAKAQAMGKTNDHPFPTNPPWYAAFERGELLLVNGDICEPIDVFDVKGTTPADLAKAQGDAQERAMIETSKTGTAHKVVVNAEI